MNISTAALIFSAAFLSGCAAGKKADRRIVANVLPGQVTAAVDTVVIPVIKLYDSLQIEFGDTLGVAYDSIYNLKLYRYIKENLGKKCSGMRDRRYNCEAFLTVLYKDVYNIDLPENCTALMKSKKIQLYSDTSYLKEGDLLFFNFSDKQPGRITNTGFYLRNGYFLLASYTKGITITALKKNFWIKRFAAAGRITQEITAGTN